MFSVLKLIILSFIPSIVFLTILICNAIYFPSKGILSSSLNWFGPAMLLFCLFLSMVLLLTKFRKFSLSFLFLAISTFFIHSASLYFPGN